MNVPAKDTKRAHVTALWWVGVVLAVLVAFALGALVHWGLSTAQPGPAPSAGTGNEQTRAQDRAPTKWTCSMHPQIQKGQPGKCPICAMDLIPLKAAAKGDSPREFTTSRAAKALMEIETAPVERKFVTAEVRMVGKIDFDETRLAYLTAWVPGRLDRLFVDYTGVPVKKGDHMVSLYSPELLSAQEELLQALKAVKELAASDVGIVRETAQGTVEAARERLRLWGLKKEQVDAIEKRGKASDHLTIYAPAGGIVIHKNAQQGMYVKTGTRIYTIADLSQVWVRLDAYESDLVWLRYGQKLTFTTVAYPGETFTGTIAFIDPVLNATTRTVKVRVNSLNTDGRLRPGMFVKAVVRADVAAGGKVMDPKLAGKWICYMHPDVIKEQAGTCDICEMPLVRTESVGYAPVRPTEAEKPLVIPASAALVTGTRAVVYVVVPGRDTPTYEGREIALGPRAGDYYLVRRGVREGERVVTRGAFKIDSQLQIEARPSMMMPDAPGTKTAVRAGAPASRPSVGAAFRAQLGKVVAGYLDLQGALAGDDLKKARAALSKTTEALGAVDMGLVTGEAHHTWMKDASQLKHILSDAGKATDIESLRRSFALLSDQMLAVATHVGGMDKVLYRHTCPMAFNNRGASWLQQDQTTRNPYFGAAMFSCGKVTDVISEAPGALKPGAARE